MNDKEAITVVFDDHLPNDCVVHVHPGGGLSFVEEDEKVETVAKTILVGGYDGVHEFAIRVKEPDRTSATDLFQVLDEFRKQLKILLPESASAVVYVAGPHIDLDASDD